MKNQRIRCNVTEENALHRRRHREVLQPVSKVK